VFGWFLLALLVALLVGLALPPQWGVVGSLSAFVAVVLLGAAFQQRGPR
jgi:hypothetical protein